MYCYYKRHDKRKRLGGRGKGTMHKKIGTRHSTTSYTLRSWAS